LSEKDGLPARRGRVTMLLTNPATFDQRPLKEAHVLAKAGFSVTILAWDRELETSGDSAFEDGLVIKRMRLSAGHGTPFLTAPKLVLFYVWCMAHLLWSRSDVVHCHDVDTLPAGFAVKAASLWRIKLVYDMHDLPEAFLRFFPMTKYTQKVFLAGARRLASAIIVVNERFVGYLGSLGFDRSKLLVVMNALPAESGRKARPRGEVFNVLYYGWLGEERGVRLLVDAVRGMLRVTLTLAGRGELEAFVRSAAETNSQVRYRGWLKMEDLEKEIREADLIPSLYEPKSKNALLATPGKLLTAMSISVPSLVPRGTYQAEIVERFHCGLVVDWSDTDDVRRAIRRLSLDDALYYSLAESAYRAFQTSFSWEVMGERLSGLYSQLLRTKLNG